MNQPFLARASTTRLLDRLVAENRQLDRELDQQAQEKALREAFDRALAAMKARQAR